MQVASDGSALGRRHPEVGAAGVKNDLEVLGRSSDLDVGEVWAVSEGRSSTGKERSRHTLGVEIVGDGNGVVLGRLDAGLAVAEGVLGTRVLLLEVLDLILHRESLLYNCSATVRGLHDGRQSVTNHLVLKWDLLDLHLVDSGRLGGGAKNYMMRRQLSSEDERQIERHCEEMMGCRSAGYCDIEIRAGKHPAAGDVEGAVTVVCKPRSRDS